MGEYVVAPKDAVVCQACSINDVNFEESTLIKQYVTKDFRKKVRSVLEHTDVDNKLY